jgi:hypothetical protein
VIGRLFRTLGGSFLPAFLAIFAVGGVTGLVNYAVMLGITLSAAGDLDRITAQSWISIVTSFTVLALTYAMATAVTTQAAMAVEDGDRVSFVRLFRPALAALLPVAFVGAIYAVVFTVAAFFFLVPSLFVRIFWIVAGPVRAGEKIVWLNAFGRSASLTDGSRLMVALLSLLYGLAMTVLFYVLFLGLLAIIGGVMSVLPQVSGMGTNLRPLSLGASIVFMLLYLAVTTLLMMINAALPAALYVELRTLKEGASTRSLDQVFA